MVQVSLARAAVFTAAIALAAPAAEPQISVEEAAGTYRVNAQFVVPAPATAVAAVLTDYERIPDFMPDVKSSEVLSRNGNDLVVEQAAIAKFMMFSKRVHLVLDVSENGNTIRFRDRCAKSFTHYEGAWHLSHAGGQTQVVYQLAAKPAFEVPGFVLKRLLKRDATVMIERLTAEIASRWDRAK